jgi:hypothetical protein
MIFQIYLSQSKCNNYGIISSGKTSIELAKGKRKTDAEPGNFL